MKISWFMIVLWFIIGIMMIPFGVNLEIIFFPEDSLENFVDLLHLTLFVSYCLTALTMVYFRANRRYNEAFNMYRLLNIFFLAGIVLLFYKYVSM